MHDPQWGFWRRDLLFRKCRLSPDWSGGRGRWSIMGRSSWVLGDMMPVLGLDHRSALIYLRLGEETRWSRDAQGEARKH